MYLVQNALDECRDHFLKTRLGTTPNTFRSHARIIGQAWPDMPIIELTRRHIQVWVAESRSKCSPTTINHRLSFLKAACDMAIEAGHIEHSPMVGVKRLKVQASIPRDLTPEEESQLARYMPQAKAWSIVRFAILTGLRRAEQFRLKIADIDFSDANPKKAGMRVQGSKGTRWRWIPLNEEALSIAKAWATRGGPYLFNPEVKGCRVRAGRLFYHAFHKAVKESGIPRTRWHDLRHAFASRVVQQPKATLYHAQTLLGHNDPRSTMIYAHLQDQHIRQFTDGIR